jgi:hypothetical protein
VDGPVQREHEWGRFCLCARVVIGNLERATAQALWNSERLVEIRETFRRGVFPGCCEGQLCPPVANAERARRGSMSPGFVRNPPAADGAGARKGRR